MSNIPDLTASVGVPRIAAIEHPFGLTMGLPGDAAGQIAVLRAVLAALESIQAPGSIEHLPFEWPEHAQPLNTHPAEPPPIAKHIVRRPWLLSKLLRRNPP
jgi:hypothetical protein